ncbi:MAG TPA: type II toxin-antitoxin system VapC family toxin [Microthrixaceae bacterium]|nr:type II toxin-antitoxin system VapC family toxin [Microthrixaceae bacterium]HNI35297.1 type II toxin-antitoxin system VapC family toxin [Microthrixaceae bacterium]
MIVLDASVLGASLVRSSTHSDWALEIIRANDVVAPAHLLVETSQMLRRLVLSGLVSPQETDAAHVDLLNFDVGLYPYDFVGPRVWELRHNLTTYDGCYVALAEVMELPLATLDERLARASGPTCEFLLPPAN